MMSDAEMNVEDSLVADPAHTFASEMGLDLLNFCMDQLERGMVEASSSDNLDEDTFEASAQIVVHTHLPQCQSQVAERDADEYAANNPEDSDPEALEVDLPEVDAVCR
jgi:hypothetical protein